MSDADDTARLILMDTGLREGLSVREFARRMADSHPSLSLGDIMARWDKFVGNRDRGGPPTHDYVTGAPRVAR